MEPVDKQYVQHISGVGAIWEVMEETPSWMREGRVVQEHEWAVREVRKDGDVCRQHLLPRSEYRLCAPPVTPKVWRNVSAACMPFAFNFEGNASMDTALYLSHDGALVRANHGYRLRKVDMYRADREPAFFVEREEEA